MTTRILIVEDSNSLRKLIGETLRRQGYSVFEAWSLESARKLLPSVKPAIMLLDLQLGDAEGAELLSDGSADGVMTIVISSRRDDEQKVGCLDLGAEDYIVKPIDLTEALLRIKRIEKLATKESAPKIADFGGFFVDFSARRVIQPDGETAILSECEYRLLRLFAAAEGEVLARAMLSQQALDRDHEDNSRAVDVLVSKLRRKLDPTGRASPIHSVRGQGYRFASRRREAAQASLRPPGSLPAHLEGRSK